MKKLLLALPLFGAMIGLIASPAVAQDNKVTDAERTKIEQVVKDLLVKEPELVMQAAQRMQQREQEKQLKAASVGIQESKKELYENKNSPTVGAKDADVTVVEFFDYNCGFCKRAHPVTEQLRNEDKKVRYVYKQFPILGPTSLTAAQYAVAAQKQGKFVEFHEALMDDKDHVSDETLAAAAKKVGLNLDKLKADAASAETKAKIDADLDLGRKVGVQGTPGFIIADKLYPGAMDIATMKQIVEAARKDKAEKK